MPISQIHERQGLGRILVLGQLRKNLARSYFNKLGVVVHACNPSYMRSVGRKIMV
jgi:hypothetical protein